MKNRKTFNALQGLPKDEQKAVEGMVTDALLMKALKRRQTLASKAKPNPDSIAEKKD